MYTVGEGVVGGDCPPPVTSGGEQLVSLEAADLPVSLVLSVPLTPNPNLSVETPRPSRTHEPGLVSVCAVLVTSTAAVCSSGKQRTRKPFPGDRLPSEAVGGSRVVRGESRHVAALCPGMLDCSFTSTVCLLPSETVGSVKSGLTLTLAQINGRKYRTAFVSTSQRGNLFCL